MSQLEIFATQLATGRPKPLPATAPTGQRFVFSEQLDRRLFHRVALTLERISACLRNAEQGWTEEQCDLFESRIEADAHLRAALENRNESVALKPWTLVEGGPNEIDKAAARELEQRLRLVPNFADTLSHQLQYVPYGWAVSEIQWEMRDGVVAPVFFDHVPHRRFTFARETDEILLRVTQDPVDGIPLQPAKFWTTCRGRARLSATAGLMRTLVWWSTFKTFGVRDWMVLSDRFGIPFVTGAYDENASNEDIDVLKRAVRDLGTDGWAVFSQLADINIHEIKHGVTGNSAEGIHGALINLCDMQMSKLVEGATLVSEVQGPGSHALGTVHENRYHDILEGDGEKLSESFQHAIGVPFVHFNRQFLGARPPRLKIHLRLNMSLRDQIGIALDLANKLDGFELDEEQLRTMTLLRRPQGRGLRGLEAAKLAAEPAPGDEPASEDNESEPAETDE